MYKRRTKMKTTGNIVHVLCLVVALFLIPLQAQASSYIYTIPGTHAARGGLAEELNAGTAVTFATWMEARRSYECTLVGGITNGGLSFTNSGGPSGSSVTPTACGLITPRIAVPTTDSDGAANNRLCLIADVSGRYTFTAETVHSSKENVRFECIETTIYGGYNTNANDFNFLEIINTTSTTLNYTIYAVNWDGTVVLDNVPGTVAANQRVDIDIHSSAGANMFGMIQVSHDGPYGALQAAVSQYTGPVSTLTLRASIPLKPRDQKL
jgi:hypothetical protein